MFVGRLQKLRLFWTTGQSRNIFCLFLTLSESVLFNISDDFTGNNSQTHRKICPSVRSLDSFCPSSLKLWGFCTRAQARRQRSLNHGRHLNIMVMTVVVSFSHRYISEENSPPQWRDESDDLTPLPSSFLHYHDLLNESMSSVFMGVDHFTTTTLLDSQGHLYYPQCKLAPE